MSVLVIAEKPSVARDIAKVLSCTKRGDGFLYGEKYIVSWAIGHLLTLCEPEDYDPALKRWSIQSLPIIPEEIRLKTIQNTQKQFEILKKSMNSDKVDEIICATDSGREGELIFRYIYQAADCKKPFKRLWISSMTDAAIKKGFANLKEGSEYDNLYQSAKCRSEADWLVGINATRAFTVKYDALLTIGRVQTPTLSLLVANKKEIEAFVPVKYWELQATFDTYKGTWFHPTTKESKIDSQELAKEIQKKIKGKTGVVADIQTEEKKMPHPFLFDLTDLQRECNKKFGFSAQKTLDIAQSLYEKHKLITYPRTDSRYLTQDMAAGVRKVLEKLADKYGDLVALPLSQDPLRFTKRVVDESKVSDHHAIIPTGKRSASLSADENAVFDLIARRLIAVFYPPYTYAITKVITQCEEESFLSKGQTIIDLGWRRVLGKENDEGDLLPPLAVGNENKVTATKVLNKSTKPPAPYTEATLLSAMENAGRFVEDEALKEQLKEAGLGTPATRAAIIERLIKVGYVKRVKKNLIATEKAVKLIAIVPKELKSPETTAKWERALSRIAKGDMDIGRFNDSIKRYVHHITNEAKKAKPSIVFEQENQRKPPASKSLGKCPLCEGFIMENSKSFYCSNWRRNCKFTIWKNALDSSGITLDSKLMRTLLAEQKVDDIPAVLSSTKQSGTCSLKLDSEIGGYIGLMNFTAKEE